MLGKFTDDKPGITQHENPEEQCSRNSTGRRLLMQDTPSTHNSGGGKFPTPEPGISDHDGDPNKDGLAVRACTTLVTMADQYID